LSPLRIALAVAPLPPPPLRVTFGSTVYPDPPEVTVMPLTKPAVIVATAVAVSPAKARPIERDINTATVISHPETFITGKLPAFLGYRIPFGDCNGMKTEFHAWRLD
jgi:hypothetical protein